MNSSLTHPFSFFCRILLASLVLISCFGKVTALAGTVVYIASKGPPAPAVLAALTAALELGAGLALAIGFQARWAALALAVFTLIASFVFHNFWDAPADQQMVQTLMFLKNVSIAGGLLTVVAFGAGAWSLDGGRADR
jgi:putative oxidoreductase